uniref:Uncharacterized protein n=1 Tax=Arundo donax TaxID=35708 RepID=A0A0A9H2W0_ARUDO
MSSRDNRSTRTLRRTARRSSASK